MNGEVNESRRVYLLEKKAPVTVAIPTWRRSTILDKTLTKIFQCDPSPAEVLIHIDAGDLETAPLLEAHYNKKVTWVQSNVTQGPGGGRNILTKLASFPIVVNFDDDSWPVTNFYLERLLEIFTEYPDAGVITCVTRHPGAGGESIGMGVVLSNSFENCSSAVRKRAFLEVGGYLPLRYAYGMEEVDLSLRLLDRGWKIYRHQELEVFHDTMLSHHASSQVNSAHIKNTALLGYLRYPKRYAIYCCMQVLNRIKYSLSRGRFKGVITGACGIPRVIYQYRFQRKAVSPRAIRLHRELARSQRKFHS